MMLNEWTPEQEQRYRYLLNKERRSEGESSDLRELSIKEILHVMEKVWGRGEATKKEQHESK